MLVILWFCALVTVLNIGRQLPERATRWDFSVYYISVALLREGVIRTQPIFHRSLRSWDLILTRFVTQPTRRLFLLCMEPLAR